ncbi:MAG: UDP-N-acetylmuramate dehydrogenase [Alphaproteobacteria bacterium]|nr:UDP-N-acetylmuramate dehydrogenase [Alphaproteobacteria bacterium]OJV45504.1 MAG: UDP-N-acetylenolpyruvoylglucosamine reductase [Alphaproteobacteria bacterium 43-37]
MQQKFPINDTLKATLEQIKGRVQFDAPLGALTWFRVGGVAQVLIKPSDIEDLQYIQKVALDNNLPVTVLGVGSNVIVRDGGISGITIKLGGPSFTMVYQEGNAISAGGGALDRTVAETAREFGLSGLEFLVSIPGTIGGAVFMNAGAYDFETKDALVSVEGVTVEGNHVTLARQDCGFSYRSSRLPKGIIVTRALFEAPSGGLEEITLKMQGFLAKREATQPTRTRTGGSTFKNPPGELKAWQLIDQAGCRGMMIGGAQVSHMHCNFLLNTGGATAQDIEDLGELVRKKVYEKCGVQLEWEIKRLGVNRGEG